MTRPVPSSLAYADAARASSISDADRDAFLRDGILVIRNIIGHEELAALRRETLSLVQRTTRDDPGDPDYRDFVYAARGSKRIPSRVEYVVDKSVACRALLGHPYILRTVEKLLGPSFIPTWDSMVFKLEGEGAEVAWHRDAGREWVLDTPIFNVDFYLDQATVENCVWAVPGSHRWPSAESDARLARLNDRGFDTADAVPVLMQPGDVILHDILTLHGSPATRTALRRVIYYEFRSIGTELAKGPHVPAYVPLKQDVLVSCLGERSRQAYAAGEVPFVYRPSAPHGARSSALATFRIPHEAYWIENSKASWAT
jgi:phytanoyl-CoA hydroxylase